MVTEIDLLQVVVYVLVLSCLVKPLGWYMARVYEGQLFWGIGRVGRPIENLIYRVCRIQPQQGMDWKQYLYAMLVFNILGLLAVYLIQRVQFFLPFNPQHCAAISPDLAFNSAVSFVTNTDWQAYSGEVVMSYFTQMLAFTTQNFLSAATGMSVLMALIRGLRNEESQTLGNFWVDTVRGILYILLPLATLMACILVSQGVIQNLKPNQSIQGLQLSKPTRTADAQTLPMGPVASQTAIAELGTNGGGFFNVNAAHPFQNPTPLTNFIELLALLLIPAALCYTFGMMVHDKRQGWAIYAAMLILFIPFVSLTILAEQRGNPVLAHSGLVHSLDKSLSPGGNMEGKETRFGIVGSALWTTATTSASNGATNSALDSYTPIGGLIPLWMMHLGEVVFGGVGSGMYGMLMLVIMTVFIAGLMVGRTPEYLGKKIEPYEMKMASLVILLMPMVVLITTAVSVMVPQATRSMGNPGAHGFTEILYTFTSMVNNNGSAFAGLSSNTYWYNLVGGMGMLMGRFWSAIPVLAIAGHLVQKKILPSNAGTLATHTPLFIVLLVGVILILSALSFLPALSLGPLVEHLMLRGQ